MHFSLSIAALCAISGQALSQGVGQVDIFQERSASGLQTLSLEGQTPIFKSYDGQSNAFWEVSQVGALASGERIVSIKSSLTGGYLSCSTTDEGTPCVVQESKYTTQSFIEHVLSEDGSYEFTERKTDQRLYTTGQSYLSLSPQPISNDNFEVSVFRLQNYQS